MRRMMNNIFWKINLLMILSAVSINSFARTKLPSFFMLIFVITFTNSSVKGQISMPSIFSNGMVLQQNDDVAIWGFDKPGQEIHVSGSWGHEATANVDSEGKWMTYISTPKSGGPYELKVKGSTSVNLSNIMIGEVWLAGGQSNMDRPLRTYANIPVGVRKDVQVHANNSGIRIFYVNRKASTFPLADIVGEWKEIDTENVWDYSATAYFFAREISDATNAPVGVIVDAYGGSKVEAWIDKNHLRSFPELKISDQVPDEWEHKEPTLLYNGMFYSIVPYSIKGVIWYQGESNVADASQYKLLFPELIRFWRELWSDEKLPFYFVEIAPFNYKGENSAYLREAQLETARNVPNTGMASTIDLGNCYDIHPGRKKEVGERLSLWALTNEYGFEELSTSGPIFKKMTINDSGKAELTFTNFFGGLVSYGKTLTGFSIAGEDNLFYPAEAEISNDSTITVWSNNIGIPTAVRYGFENCPDASLYNRAGLPASSFRTDQF